MADDSEESQVCPGAELLHHGNESHRPVVTLVRYSYQHNYANNECVWTELMLLNHFKIVSKNPIIIHFS